MSSVVGDRPPLPVAVTDTVAPTDVDGIREAFARARDRDLAVLVHGAGTKLAWGAAPSPEREWLAIDTRGMDRIIHHEAGDMTAIVEAGVPLARLQATLAEAGQQWAVDPPRVDAGATVGGVFAANDAGPRRHRYGGVRDLVIGIAAVLPDGTVARSGGTVIKNVAGYDLAKLHCGALGTLGVVARLALRLHPLPEASRTVRADADAAAATATVLDLLAAPLDLAAVEWSSAGGGVLQVRVEGRSEAVDAAAREVAAVVRRHAGGVAVLPPDEEEARWASLREAHVGGEGATVARGASRPGDLATVAAALAEAAADAGVDATLCSAAGIGLHDAILRGGDAAAHARVVARWRAALTALGGSVVLRERIAGVDEHVDVWLDPTAPPSTLPLMRAVKQALDPEGRCAPGRYLGGI